MLVLQACRRAARKLAGWMKAVTPQAHGREPSICPTCGGHIPANRDYCEWCN